jgi:plasmid stabilization system protein ParE
VRIEVARRAEQQADRAERWWVENRPAAPSLFIDELDRTFRLIRESPGVGVPWPARRSGVRRIFMPKTEHHVFFRVDEPKKTVFVMAVWGASRGRSPRL